MVITAICVASVAFDMRSGILIPKTANAPPDGLKTHFCVFSVWKDGVRFWGGDVAINAMFGAPLALRGGCAKPCFHGATLSTADGTSESVG